MPELHECCHPHPEIAEGWQLVRCQHLTGVGYASEATSPAGYAPAGEYTQLVLREESGRTAAATELTADRLHYSGGVAWGCDGIWQQFTETLLEREASDA